LFLFHLPLIDGNKGLYFFFVQNRAVESDEKKSGSHYAAVILEVASKASPCLTHYRADSI
jgi:hypothetical protein